MNSSSHPLKPELLIQRTKCKIVLTSKEDNYNVVACDENVIRRSKVWYLFDKKKNTFEQIDGLTTKNDFDWKPVENTNSSIWENKQWQGYRGRSSRRIWGRDMIGSPFTLKYVASGDTFKFPFFDYLSAFCQGITLGKIKGLQFLNTSCAYFDIPVDQLKDSHLIKTHLEQVFEKEEEKCFTGIPRWKKWISVKELESCNSLPDSK